MSLEYNWRIGVDSEIPENKIERVCKAIPPWIPFNHFSIF